MDEDQQRCYEDEIAAISDRLPPAEYRVFSDWPSGYKIGGGGGTLVALHSLYEEFADNLFQKRILLIHAGGYSQRQPNCSILGKIFSLLPRETPVGDPMYLFDMKLELYRPFLSRMGPGVFLAASDTLEAFDLENASAWDFTSWGFTVLAHPSSLDVARSHGVYVLDAASDVSMCDVLRVLQKPSEHLMRESGAVHCTAEHGDFAFTDSAFFFSMEVTRELLDLYRLIRPVHVELDAYGDFLQPLGPAADDAYLGDNSRVVCVGADGGDDLIRIRTQLFRTLRRFPIRALVLRQSKFYHLGSFRELLQHFCEDRDLQNKFSLKSVACSALVCRPGVEVASWKGVSGCVIQSLLCAESQVPPSSLIECCRFSAPIKLCPEVILSNCCSDKEFQLCQPVFLFTAPVRIDGLIRFCTVAFGTFQDLKKTDAPECLSFLGTNLKAANMLLRRADRCENLWSAELFPVADCPKVSFELTLTLVETIQSGTTTEIGALLHYPRLSMKKIHALAARDVLKRQQQLLIEEIKLKL